MRILSTAAIFGAAVALLAACGRPAPNYIKDPKALQEALINAKEGDTIFVDEGTIEFTASLSMMNKKNVSIKGKGMGKTILSFKGMTTGTGGEGLKVSNCDNVIVSDLTLRDMKGDGFKASECFNITMRRLQVVWSNPNDSTNGAYGLYPVTSTNVTVEDCEVANASDAGIYVGQSHNGVVRRNKVHDNVAGVEIENSFNIDVYENECYNNSGGLLVFDLPDIPVKNGDGVRVFNNNIHDNNLANFAPPANSVAIIPAGTGFLVMATNNVEVFKNKIINNKTVNCGIISYQTTGREIKDPLYNPFCVGISIHDNTFSRQPALADTSRNIGKVLAMAFQLNAPNIIYDGFVDPSTIVNGKIADGKGICIRNNEGSSFANLDIPGGMKNINTDMSAFDCTLPALPEFKAADAKVPAPAAKK